MKASFLCSDSIFRKKEKQSFLTMKVDNDSLLLRHDAGSLNDETILFCVTLTNLIPLCLTGTTQNWTLASQKMTIVFWSFYSKIKRTLFWVKCQWNQSRWNQVSLYILKKICLSVQVFRHAQLIRKTFTRTLSCQ